ncbi:MAG: AI-2E family transporter [Woeseiaceae bacterium]|nr:AI-2E family transporter [Woeseiaceae bacterium]
MTPLSDQKANAVLSIAAVFVIIYGLQTAKAILIPFLFAAFLALITIRPMLWLQRNKVPTIVAALAIVSFMMLILLAVATIVGASIAGFTAQLPDYQQQLTAIIDELIQFAIANLNADPEIQTIGDLLNPGFAMGLVANLFTALRGLLTNVFLIFFTVIFILLEASTFSTKVEAAFGRGASSLDGPRVFLVNLGRYLGIKTLVSAATGFLAWLLTWSIGLDYPLLWGMLAFLLNYVPTIGSIIAAIPPVLLAVVQFGGVAEATATMLGFMAINITFGNFIEPRLMGYGVGISPLVVFIGLFFWGWVFGPVGMLLSVPLTMTLKLTLESDESTRWIAILIGSERDAQHALELQPADGER